jgi:hypothetical protein
MILLALMKILIISTDEDPGLRIESFAVINLRGVSTNKTIINMFYRHANIQRTYHSYIIENSIGSCSEHHRITPYATF